MSDCREYKIFSYNPFNERKITTLPFRLGCSYYYMSHSEYEFTQLEKYKLVNIEGADKFSSDVNKDGCILTFVDDKGRNSRWFAHIACRKFAITKEDILGHLEAKRLQEEQTIEHAKDDLKPIFEKTDKLINTITKSEKEILKLEEAKKKFKF